MERKFNSRRGFSIVEVVIAIVVIGIVTIASITLLSRSIAIERQNVRNAEIKIYSENAIECFRFAEDRNGFFSLIKQVGSFKDENDDGVLEENEKILLVKSDYTIAITLNIEYNNIIVATTDSGSTEIYRLEYSK